MVRKLFNDLVTTLDIIPSSSVVDVCVHHPSTCALTGKVRIIAKRPCVYKSLVLTVTGTTRIFLRQGAKTIKSKQIFLCSSQQIAYEPSPRRDRSLSIPDITNPSSHQLERQQQPQVDVSSNSVNELNESNPITHPHHWRSDGHSTPPPEPEQSSTEAASTPNVATISPRSGSQADPVLNYLLPGVNDIDFRIEFPSHIQPKDQQQQQQGDMYLSSLPSGPMKTTCGDSSIVYTLSATLVMSRRDILVNNHMSTSVPFRVQCWQDAIDRRHSEDNSFHGKRRDKIEFQFQVPKQLDTRRLHELQFWFQASWRTLSDRLRVREIQYYLIEEEHQIFAAKMAPYISTTVISTTATHDFSDSNTPTNAWDHLRTPIRLQIPQPNTVLETTDVPSPHTLTVAHKLRVLIRFDQTLTKERDLQLSFPIQVHPTMDEDGTPVHPQEVSSRSSRPRRRRGRHLYGIDTRPVNEDIDGDDDVLPLPMYADREGTLLLMVGEEVQETPADLEPFEIDALGITMPPYGDQNAIVPYSHSESSMSSSSPISRRMPSFLPNELIQGEQHAWSRTNRQISLVPGSSEHSSIQLLAQRRYSSIESATDPFLPPPYRLPSFDEEPTSLMTSVSPPSSLSLSPRRWQQDPLQFDRQFQQLPLARTIPTMSHPAAGSSSSRRSQRCHGGSTTAPFVPHITTSFTTTSSMAPFTAGPTSGPVTLMPSHGMPSPPREYDDESLQCVNRQGAESSSTPSSESEGTDVNIRQYESLF
ncbi:hypothetical protein BGX28_004875 [Mortierella sp. GBA30]|nr:hypothetical protein BGX28_004875 [Mortierella sp. GBA30]